MPSWLPFITFIKISGCSTGEVQCIDKCRNFVKALQILLNTQKTFFGKKKKNLQNHDIISQLEDSSEKDHLLPRPPPIFTSDTISLLFMLVSILPSQTDLVISLESFLVDSNQCLHLQSIHSNTFSSSSYSWSNWW